MSEYIERGLAIEQCERHSGYEAWSIANGIEAIPAADVVEVKHSEWKYYHKQNIAVCMNCSFERDLNADFGKAISCPNCGAKMDA